MENQISRLRSDGYRLGCPVDMCNKSLMWTPLLYSYLAPLEPAALPCQVRPISPTFSHSSLVGLSSCFLGPSSQLRAAVRRSRVPSASDERSKGRRRRRQNALITESSKRRPSAESGIPTRHDRCSGIIDYSCFESRTFFPFEYATCSLLLDSVDVLYEWC